MWSIATGIRPFAAVAVILLLGPLPLAAAQSTVSKHRQPKQIVLRWAESIDEKTLADSVARLRISANDTVSLRVTHFNHLHYALKFNVEERTVASYVMLERLWSQILPKPSAAEAVPFGATSFEKAVVAWRRRLGAADSAVSDYIKPFAPKVALTDAERMDIAGMAKPLGSDAIDSVEDLRRSAEQLAESIGQLDIYERVLTRHDAVVAKLQAFVRAADLVDQGQVEVIGKRKAGTVVTFTITPVNDKGAQAAPPFQSSYFVRSVHPLVLHVGYAASRLDDVEFDKVRSANGGDLFLATKSSETTQSLVTFMSYEWGFGPSGEIGLHATVGTAFERPGEKLFAGAGLRVTRFILSVGLLGSDVAEGSNRIEDAVAGALGHRELFTTVRTRKTWEPFAAISLRVF